MKGIIIYKGKYGATKQYAKWLAEELKLPMLFADKIRASQLAYYDYIVLGSSVYIGKLQLAKWLRKNQALLSGKKVFLFVVCGTALNETEKLTSYINSSVPPNLRQGMIIEFLSGRLNIKKLSWLDRFMLRMGARMTKDPVERKKMLTEYDAVKKENLQSFKQKILEQTNRTGKNTGKDPVTQLAEHF